MPCLERALLPSLILTLALASGCGGDDGASSGETETASGTSDATISPTSGATTAGPSTMTNSGTETGGATESTTTDPSSTDPSTDPSATDPSTDPSATDPSTTDGTGTTDATTGNNFCEQGTVVCEDGVAKICDGMGGYETEEACDNECADGLGCVLCVPGSTMCEGEQVLTCDGMGQQWEPTETCDALQGQNCDPDVGLCDGPCAKQNLGVSYIGCDYYPTVTQQQDSYNNNPHQFAVAVSNTTNAVANVTVTRGQNTITTQQVAAQSVQIIVLPWVPELTETTGPSVMVVDGAYRLRSDQPVTVYQYNPLAASVTNDASVLLPVNTWSGNYLVASWQFWSTFNYPGFYAVVASQDGTTVTLNPSSTGGIVQAGGGVANNGTGQVMLDQGDVLQVMSASGGDLTGTIVNADKPIQVIAGHECTNVPINVTACDHLEESMFPIETLAKEYIVVPPVQSPNDALEKAQMVRVIAVEDDTQLVFEPDQGVNTNLANAGDWVEISTTINKFKVSSAKKILVAQYMVGQDGGYGTSDPAMLLAVSTEQFRDNYLFHAPIGWSANYVDIIAPDGAAVDVDGQAVAGFTQIPGTGFSYKHVKLSNNGDGNHSVSSAQKVGISVYGVLNYGSYWYPGGLDLDLIPQ
ncbi:MAG: hypothetical protein H6713_02515 [Myxococcales bacterium]|nr:hypothetical protein [Myxococcales bacterium]